MDTINGFFYEINFLDGTMSYKKKIRNYGVYEFEDERVVVCVQTSSKMNEARLLAESYKQNAYSHDFIPSRTTKGSFILVDKSNNRVIAGRDMSMANRLYLYIKDHTYFITTDSRVFLEMSVALDASIVDWVLNGIMAPLSWFRNVESIIPGHFFTIDGNGLKKNEVFWRIQNVNVPKTYNEAVELYGELFINSVKNNISNNKAAVYLSGGSDSAAVMGALKKLQIEEVEAVHMAIEGNYEFEKKAVEELQRAYGFNLGYITPPCKKDEWLQIVEKAIVRGSINSLYLSFPTYQMMGEYFRQRLPEGTTVFNGEMCILDTGFTDAGDKTRNFRRWLFTEEGRKFARIKVWPNFFAVNWDKHRQPYYMRSNVGDKIKTLHYVSNTILHSFGRPQEYYLGMKMGWRYLPGYYGGISYLPVNYHSSFLDRVTEEYLNAYTNGLKSRDFSEWKTTFNQLSTTWYCETSNFTMPADVAHIGQLSMCFPFSDVDLFDFAASLPQEWKVDKKIQKDMCKQILNMPDDVAYLMKNHKQSFSYFDYVYGPIKSEMLDVIRSTDFGPLTLGINSILNDKPQRANIYCMFALAVLVNKFKLRIE